MVGGFLLIYEFLLSKWAMGCIMGREAIWRGAEYNQRGEEQLADYLEEVSMGKIEVDLGEYMKE